MTSAVATAAPRPGTGRSRRPADLAGFGLAAGLSVAIVLLVRVQDHGSVLAAVAALAMTVPVAYARVAPTAAGVSLAVGAGINAVFFDHLIRCGASLPASFYVAVVVGLAVGLRSRIAMTGLTIAVVVQCVADPRLGAPVIVLMVPLELVFFGAGLYLRRRVAMTAELRAYADQLLLQRERTALVAVAAHRELLVSHLNATLTRHTDAIESAALSGAEDRAAFAAVERIGRETLDDMRSLVGSVSEAPTTPEPGIADLADICARATTANVRLTVEGAFRVLPASIELSACRIVEQLLRLVDDRPQARVLLTLDYDVTGLDIDLSGLVQPDADLQHIEAIAGMRAALHGGRVEIDEQGAARRARVWLPLTAARA